jgi:minor histocompatibility antigen H13
LRFDLFLYYLRQQKRAIKEGKDAPRSGVSEYPNHMTQRAKYLTATGGWGERFWTNRTLEPAEFKAKRFPKTYFHASLVGYVIGMIATLIVMQVAEHAQPALLYLVPGVLTSLWGTALIKGDLKLLWEYNEAWEEDQDKDEKKEQKRLEKDNPTSPDSKRESTTLSNADAEDEVRGEAEGSKTKEACRDLVSFSITLPPMKLESPQDKTEPTSDSDKITTELAEAMNDEVSGSIHTNRDAVAPLPDIEADNAVIAKLERTLTGEVVDGGSDRQPPEKRRRKA